MMVLNDIQHCYHEGHEEHEGGCTANPDIS